MLVFQTRGLFLGDLSGSPLTLATSLENSGRPLSSSFASLSPFCVILLFLDLFLKERFTVVILRAISRNRIGGPSIEDSFPQETLRAGMDFVTIKSFKA